jgi:hypothetical protein
VAGDEWGRPVMRCIIAGSRKVFDWDLVFSIIDQCPFRSEIEEVVSGTQKSYNPETCQYGGVDWIGEMWADKNGRRVRRFGADWKNKGRRAGPLRNEEMAKYADALIALPMGESRGTRDMIRRAKAHGLRVWVYELEGTDNGRADHQAR